MKRLQNGPLSGVRDQDKIKKFLSEVTKLHRNKQMMNEHLHQLEQTHVAQKEQQMQFSENATTTTADSLSSTYQGVGGQSVLFDIMQTKLSDNV